MGFLKFILSMPRGSTRWPEGGVELVIGAEDSRL